MRPHLLVAIASMLCCWHSHCLAQATAKADSLMDSEQYNEAIVAYHKLIAGQPLPPAIDVANAWLRSGKCLVLLEKYEAGLKNYFTALSLFEKINQPERLATAYSNIASVYYVRNDYNAAKKYYLQARYFFEQCADSAAINGVLNDLALIYFQQQKTDSAITLHRLALTRFAAHSTSDLACRHWFNLGSCFEKTNSDSALLYYSKASRIAEENEDSAMLSAIYNNIGDVHKERGDFNTALQFFKNSAYLNAQYGDSAEQAVICRNLADVYDSLGLFENAYIYARQERIINEALYNNAKAKIAAELSEQYESNKKDEQIKAQQIENQLKSRNLILVLLGLALALTLAFISFVSYKRKQKANVLLQQQKQRIEQLNDHLNASNQVKSMLFSIISHDLRSPISSIYAWLQMHQSNTSSKESSSVNTQVSQLLDTLEDLLVWSKSQLNQFTPTPEKIDVQDMVKQLFKLQATAVQQKNIVLHNQIIQQHMPYTDANMLAIVIRNIMANVVKHAAPNSHLTISSQQGTNIILSFVNQLLPGSDVAALTHAHQPVVGSSIHGLGTTLIKEFTAKMGGTVQYHLHEDELTTVLCLPAATHQTL